MELTAVFERVPEGYVGFVEELRRANTQAGTLKENGLRKNALMGPSSTSGA